MKSKNIPADIRVKTSKEAQIEIKEIILSLESGEKKLQDSMEKYNRMLLFIFHSTAAKTVFARRVN